MSTATIIIPSYNHERYVTQAVESALAQTYPQVEIIVVDDGSHDNTRGMLAPYADRIRYIYQDNKGASAARNTGLRAASGDYILFLDADDLIPQNKLEQQIRLLEAHPEYGLVYCAWQNIDEHGNMLGANHPQFQGHVIEALLLRQFFFPPGAAVIRKSCLEEVGGFDETLHAAEDPDLWIRIAAAGHAFGYSDEPLYRYRQLRASLSHNVEHQLLNEQVRLEKFFSRTDLPPHIAALKSSAFSVIYYEYAARFYHGNDIARGQTYLRQAILTDPARAANHTWLLDWIAGFALGPDVENAPELIDRIFDHLPAEAENLRGLRRQAQGRYHAASAFSCYWNQDAKGVSQHLLPALIKTPSIAGNRGFLRIAAWSLSTLGLEWDRSIRPATRPRMTSYYWKIAVTILIPLIMLTGSVDLLRPAPPVDDSDTMPWQLVFQDEFNETELDRDKWQTLFWWGDRTLTNNEELQYYVDDAFEFQDGHLRIKAEQQDTQGYPYASGLISSYNSYTFQYGYVEIRARVPSGAGLWPAFWMLPLGDDPPEIDIMEILGFEPNKVYMTNNYFEDFVTKRIQRDYIGPDFSEDFHTFGVKWEEDRITWYIDDVQRFTTDQYIPQEPMFILANLAVGGWGGEVAPDTVFPSYFDIDYIRVYQQEPATDPLPDPPPPEPTVTHDDQESGITTLASCRITTRYMMRLHRAPNRHSAIITRLPYNIHVRATVRAGRWFKVNYENQEGWINGAHAVPKRKCNP